MRLVCAKMRHTRNLHFGQQLYGMIWYGMVWYGNLFDPDILFDIIQIYYLFVSSDATTVHNQQMSDLAGFYSVRGNLEFPTLAKYVLVNSSLTLFSCATQIRRRLRKMIARFPGNFSRDWDTIYDTWADDRRIGEKTRENDAEGEGWREEAETAEREIS